MAKRGPINPKAGARPSDHLFQRPRTRKDPKTRDGEEITDAGLTGSELTAIQRQLREDFYAREAERNGQRVVDLFESMRAKGWLAVEIAA